MKKLTSKNNFCFSLIIPFYNSYDHFERCIKSILKSYLMPSEIIVVDDCSLKSQSKKCKQLLQKFKKFNTKYFLLKKNLGPGGARNYGVKKSSHNLIFFIDSDTEVLKDTFSVFKNSISKYDAVVGVYDLEPINKTISAWYKATFYFFLYEKKIIKYDQFSASCSGIKKKCFVKVGGYNRFFKRGLDFENEELGHRISKNFNMVLNRNMRVKHFFPGILKMAFLFFKRTQYWMEMFLVRKKFSKTANSSNTAFALIYSPIMFFLLTLFVIFEKNIFLIILILISILHIISFKFFYIYHLKKNILNCIIMFLTCNFFNLFIIGGSLIGFFKYYLNLSKIKRKFK